MQTKQNPVHRKSPTRSNSHTPNPSEKHPDPNRTQVVGVLNLTPDSFSDGGQYIRPDQALARVEEMIADGVDWIDVGGVSTRPGAPVVSLEEEHARVIPILKALCPRFSIPFSLDTSRYEIAREGLGMGVRMINDIRALRQDDRLPALLAGSTCTVVLMHMQGEPQTMQQGPVYKDVVGEIIDFFHERIAAVKKEGIQDERIILDPGIGFGKQLPHNLEIFQRLSEICELGYPVMVGPSRKSLIGEVLHVPVEERAAGTGALVTLAIQQGARYVRVHDTREMVQIARMTDAVVKKR
jgi:dihydropteroate synthase